MSRINMPYATYFNRWPEPDEAVAEKSLMDHWNEIWRQYYDILDNGKGLQALQALCVQIEKEIIHVKNEIEQFPEENDTSEFGFLFSKENAKDRLDYSLNQLKIRDHIIKSVITQFTVNGKVYDQPPEVREKINKIIHIAVKDGVSKENREEASRFMETYSRTKEEFPEFNPTNFIEEIDWNGSVSVNTLKAWMEKFDEAEAELKDLLSNSP